MRVHHVCLCVSDLKESLKLYCDFLGFELYNSPGLRFGPTLSEDITGVKDAKGKVRLLVKDDVMLEVNQFFNPLTKKVPREILGYGNVGLTELALTVDDIDEWFEKVKAAGYETQTDYVWEAGIYRSFLFYDPDDILIQLIQEIPQDGESS